MALTVLSVSIILEFIFFDVLASKDTAFMERDPYFPPVWKRLFPRFRLVNRVLFVFSLAILLLKALGVMAWW